MFNLILVCVIIDWGVFNNFVLIGVVYMVVFEGFIWEDVFGYVFEDFFMFIKGSNYFDDLSLVFVFLFIRV